VVSPSVFIECVLKDARRDLRNKSKGDTLPYNETLDARITTEIKTWRAVRKNMFGGVCHLLKGNMLCGVYKDFLIARIGEQAAAQALKEPYVKVFDITGRAMKDWVMVEEKGFQGGRLKEWLEKAKVFFNTLPPKE
jgi:hypothetical protein